MDSSRARHAYSAESTSCFTDASGYAAERGHAAVVERDKRPVSNNTGPDTQLSDRRIAHGCVRQSPFRGTDDS